MHTSKKIARVLALGILIVPVVASAQTSLSFADFVTNIVQFVNDYVIKLLYAIAFVGFVWGLFKYFFLESADEHKRSEGRQFVLWGLIGLVVLFTVWSLVNMLLRTFSLGS